MSPIRRFAQFPSFISRTSATFTPSPSVSRCTMFTYVVTYTSFNCEGPGLVVLLTHFVIAGCALCVRDTVICKALSPRGRSHFGLSREQWHYTDTRPSRTPGPCAPPKYILWSATTTRICLLFFKWQRAGANNKLRSKSAHVQHFLESPVHQRK